MTFPLSALLLALFGLSLILTTLSLRFLRGSPQEKEPTSASARFFLIALRLAIGWHCFFEGMEKLKTPTWSSEVYLRESMGPLADVFRSIPGDRLVEKLTVGENNAFPSTLDREWRDNLQTFASHYGLTEEQLKRAEGILDQQEKDTLTTLISKSEEVSKISPLPKALRANAPPLTVHMTITERLQEHQRLQDKLEEFEAQFPSTEKKLHESWKQAKDDLNEWRADLKKTLDAETYKLKKKLGDDVLTAEQKRQDPISPTKKPLSSWQLLEWSDFLVTWSLLVFGGCLMLGLFSRLASLATAFLLLSFYLSMPPLPGWPESPRLEGHYVLINKTLIEIIALLALTFIPTGRWAGIDGILHFIFGRERSQNDKPVSQEKPRASSAGPSAPPVETAVEVS